MTVSADTCLPFVVTLAKRCHFLILIWTGVGQTTF